MERIITRANAKINLTLDILGRRSDGYHELETIMHEIPLFDRIEINISDGDKFTGGTNLSFIKTEKNIAIIAAKKFMERIGVTRAIDIRIEKNIPVGAGLGGGSADAAAVLRELNLYFKKPLNRDELISLAAEIGADVPFCLYGGCALCGGIGEKLQQIAELPPCYIVLVKPPVSISTGLLFSMIDKEKIKGHPDTEGVKRALKEGLVREVSLRLYNVMEETAAKVCPDIRKIRYKMIAGGAFGSVMSGSGSCVYGIFESEGVAAEMSSALKKQFNEVFCLKLGKTE